MNDETAEAPDPFADTAPDAGSDDPFADPPADPAEEIAAEVPGEQEVPPVVDREGEPVEAPQTTQEQPAPAAATPEAPAAQEAPPAVQEAPAPPAAKAPTKAEQKKAAKAEAKAAGEAKAAPAPAPAPAPAAAAPAAPAPETAEAASDKMRRYKVMYQTSPTTWEVHKLDVVPPGVNVVEENGEKWILARNNDHALRISYTILERPQGGVTLWPAPQGAYKPKRVKPAPPQPERERLEIG